MFLELQIAGEALNPISVQRDPWCKNVAGQRTGINMLWHVR